MPLEKPTIDELARTRTIDFTTYGRRSGRPSRVEIWWFHFEDRFIITGTPGPRDWMANVRTDPRVIIHALGNDHHGTALEIDDAETRRRFFSQSQDEVGWYRSQAELERLVDEAPMIEVSFP